MLHIPIVHARDVSKQIPRENTFSTQEARVALGYASSNSYASFVLSKLPACFISRWRMNQFLIDYLLDKKVHLRPLRIYENWGNHYQPRYRVMVAESIEMSAIFELDARWSVYYAHCTFCIALKLALTTSQFKRSDIKIEHSRLKIDSPIRRTNKSASLLYLF